MANKTIKTRIQNKYDVEKNWDQASFTPLKGELIFYGPDKDDEGNVLHELPRFKVGDGETPIGQLPIVDVSTGGGSGTNDYNDLINKPELGTLAAKNEVAKADLASDVQASLDRVDFATGGTMEGSLTVNGDVTVSGAVHGTSDKAEMLKALEIPFDSNNPWHCIGYFQYDGDGTTEAEETSRQTATIVINPPQGSFSMLFFIDISLLSGSKYDSCVLLVKQMLGYEYTRNSGNILACAIDENSNRVYVYAYAKNNTNGNLLVSVVSASHEFHLDVDSTKNCADITEKWNYAKSEYVPVDRAVSDEQGNKIAKTYATKTELSTATTDIEASLSGKVPTSRTVNGKALSENITLSASDVKALPDTTKIPADFANGGTMGGSLVINGDLTVNGTATTVEIFNENVNVEDNTITLRHNTTTGLSSGDYTGIIAHKYDGTNNGMLVFDNNGTAYVGDEGDLQPLATRSFSDNDDGAIVAWNNTKKILVRAPLEKGSGVNSIQQVNNTASGDYSNATGNTTQAVGKSTHSEGTNTVAFGESSHAEGRGSTVTFTAADLLLGTDVLVDKWKQQDVDSRNSAAIGIASHVEGNGNVAAGHDSHAEGRANLALGNRSHAEGSQTEARGNNSHTEGTGTIADALNAHAEGNGSVASGTAAHAEGNATTASGDNSHAEGYSTEATTLYAHAEGYLTKANGQASHAEGNGCVASNANSHAEGFQTKATANNAHAEGGSTTASGQSSHAEGTNTIASGHSSHASGYGTQATATAQTVVGKNNALNDNALFIVGNGKSSTNRSNAFEVISTDAGVSIKVGNTVVSEAQLNKLISFIDAATYDTASNTWSFN